MGDTAPLVNSFGFAVAAACIVTLGRHRLQARGFRWSPLGILTALGGGAAIWLAVTPQAGMVSGVLSGPVAAAGGSFDAGLEAKPAEAKVAADPQTVLRQDRTTFWTTALAGGLAIGLATVFVVGSVLGTSRGIQTGLANGVATGLAWGFLQARFGSFTIARWWLALRGRVPWKLMPFLADAHRRGSCARSVPPTSFTTPNSNAASPGIRRWAPRNATSAGAVGLPRAHDQFFPHVQRWVTLGRVGRRGVDAGRRPRR
ncbi:hypothetical protein E1265_32985 [Streptomyces sp. 8K308]|uniref:hypothetical protein n=1 Tax=Streptomyces sp. 8K308 TaxID=2530388 RepID=UPI00104EE2E4|nr:hypothetical protein [Streptomyces sp. 8K308]TDC08630.1 hypothetical protein E1265_32985 [Streptomyces sp. 8K308]